VAFAVVLDACVLYPASLRDTLLRFASRDWSAALGSSTRSSGTSSPMAG